MKAANPKAPLQNLKGRLFILAALILSCRAAFAAEAAPTGAAWDENREVKLRGERLEYFQSGELLQGSGGVELESGPIKVSAREIELDLRTNTLTARGNVVWSQDGNTIYAESVSLNLKTQQGKAEQLLFRRDSWAAWGERSEKTGEKDLSLERCEASSCLREHPHYRLRASSIHVRLGERIWLSNVVVYIGMALLFYFPYYTQSLKDPRPPFEIRPGYNKQTGAFLRAAYNYFLTDDQWGTVRVDWMDKLGTGYGLSHHYRMLGGEGEMAGYATRDKNDPDHPSWTGNFSHRQELGHGLRLLGNIDMLSQYRVNETYDLKQVDTFQNRSYFSLQSGQADYSWSAGFGETQVLQQKFGADPADPLTQESREYVVTTRSLPMLTFSRYSRPLIRDTALYWGLSGQLARSLVVPQTLTPFGALYDLGRSYYNDTASLTPSLSHSQRLISGSALSSSLNFSQSFTRNEGEDGTGRVSLGTLYEVLNLPLDPALNVQLGWRYSRQLSQPETLRFSGILDQRLTFNGTLVASESLNLLASTDYDLLPYRVDDELKRLGLIRAQALYAPDEHRSLSLVSAYHAQTGQVKSIDSNLALNDPKKLWQFGAGTSWVNNRIYPAPSLLDPNAPPSYAYEEPRRSADQFLLNWRCSFAATEHWGLSLYQRLNVAARHVEEQAFSFRRDLHCWDLELYGRERAFTGWQFGFTLTLRALPQVRASSNQVTNDLFDDVSYGY
jgi:lipopolysaccharide export system protein LptA